MILRAGSLKSGELEGLKFIVAGGGFYGSVMAERIASDMGERVVVVEKRTHVGGNSYSEKDPETGIERHKYGSHIFHTGNAKVWEYVNRFCRFNGYRHRVAAAYKGRLYPWPIDLDTINGFYGTNMSAAEAERFLRAEGAVGDIPAPRNLEEQAVSMMGRRLYEVFVEGYTSKQWDRHPADLPPDAIKRLPVRFSRSAGYFSDKWQGVPEEGYGELFRNMLSHPKIQVYPGTDFFEIRELIPASCRIIYTGPVDEYFGYMFGRLGWRSLVFEEQVIAAENFQGMAVVNYPEISVPFTRIHEFRHLHAGTPAPAGKTLIAREYPADRAAGREPLYPVNAAADKEIYARYSVRGRLESGTIFGGRLGGYRYLDMDQAVAEALETYELRIRKADRAYG